MTLPISIATDSLPYSEPPISKISKIDLCHSELLCNTLLEAMMPIKQVAFYFFPFIGNLYSYHMEIREKDPAQQSMIPHSKALSAIKEINQLAKAAHLSQRVVLFASLSHYFSSFGGPFSILNPTITIPYADLISEKTTNSLWNKSEPEIRFFIARELARIKSPTFLLHTAMKVSLLGLMHYYPILPLSFLAQKVMIGISLIAFHCFLEKKLQRQMDIQAVVILSEYLQDVQQAKKIALSALNKIKEQNICRLNFNKLCHLYISSEGENLFDVTHDSLFKRIERLNHSDS